MTMQKHFFSGDSLAQAVNQAAQHFQLRPAEVKYRLVDKRHGFLKVRRKVVIEVDESDPRKEAEASGADRVEAPRVRPASPRPEVRTEPVRTPREREKPDPEPEAQEPTAAGGEGLEEREPESVAAPDAAGPSPMMRQQDGEDALADAGGQGAEEGVQPVAPSSSRRRRGRRGRRGGSRQVELADAPLPAKSRYKEARGEEAEAAAEALEKILKLADLVLESEILQAEEHLQVELRGADQDLLLRDRGRLLLAIQHLLPRVIRGLIGRSVLCKVDSDNYHEIREERLRDMAQRAADEVRHRGRPKTLEPMSPDERRIVHLTLADYPGVETESHGSGLFKRVMVRSTDGGQSRDYDYRR